MLASLVKQLCARRPVLPPVIDSLYEYKERGERPDVNSLETALMAAVGGFSTVHIIVDALDECPVSQGERRKLLDSIRRIAVTALANVHIFCTSRKEADIDAVLGPMVLHPQRAALNLTASRDVVDQDIGLYIDSVLASPDFESWPENIKVEAREVLIQKADGM